MDGSRFDDLARTLARPASRRGVLGVLAGGLAALLTGPRPAGAACPPDQVPAAGGRCVCQTTGRPPTDGACPCASGQHRCGATCRSSASYANDPANCGACGTVCPPSAAFCVKGTCRACRNDRDCAGEDACSIGRCAKGTCLREPVVCDDGKGACTTKTCDPATGCVFAPVSCDDGDACTTDTCDPVVGCQHTAVVCPGADACHAAVCARQTGCRLECVGGKVCCDDGGCCDAATEACRLPGPGCCRQAGQVCPNGNGDCCSGVCVDGTCLIGPVEPGSACEEDGDCVSGACNPISRFCCQTACSDGVPCAGSGLTCGCPTGQHLCGSECAGNTDVATCGARCTPCDTPPNSSATCDGTSCGFVCDDGYKRCDDHCIARSACCTAADCPLPTDGTCRGERTCQDGVCDFVPAPAETPCRTAAGECDVAATCDGTSLDCPPNGVRHSGTPCGDGPSCVGGRAHAQDTCDGAGTCQPGSDTDCTLFRCGAEACLERCTDDDECVDGAHCDADVCLPDEGIGEPCDGAGDCSNGVCNPVSQVCCASACGAGEPCLGPNHTCGCPLGQHLCFDGACYSETDPTHCGPDCEFCFSPGDGAATCDAGQCGFVCDEGYSPIGSGCCSAALVCGEFCCPSGQVCHAQFEFCCTPTRTTCGPDECGSIDDDCGRTIDCGPCCDAFGVSCTVAGPVDPQGTCCAGGQCGPGGNGNPGATCCIPYLDRVRIAEPATCTATAQCCQDPTGSVACQGNGVCCLPDGADCDGIGCCSGVCAPERQQCVTCLDQGATCLGVPDGCCEGLTCVDEPDGTRPPFCQCVPSCDGKPCGADNDCGGVCGTPCDDGNCAQVADGQSCCGPTGATTLCQGACCPSDAGGDDVCLSGQTACPAPCVWHSDCPGNQFCDFDGTCLDDLPDGNTCDFDEQCRSAHCCSNVCCPASRCCANHACAAEGEVCCGQTADSTVACSRDHCCADGQCASSSFGCDDPTPCLLGDERCADGRCPPIGGACCESTLGTSPCCPNLDGFPCEGACCTDACCEAGDCCDGTCCQGDCCPAGPEGASVCCGPGERCCGEYCIPFDQPCCDDRSATGEQPCCGPTFFPCPAGKCCNGVCASGENEICCGWGTNQVVCRQHFCCPNGTCRTEGESCQPCTIDNDCAFTDQFCNANNVCVDRRQADAPCTRHSQCASDVCCNGRCCLSGRCIDLVCADGSCATDAECAPDEYCRLGRCTPRRLSGQSCGRDEQCLSDQCCGGHCCSGFCCQNDTCVLPGVTCATCEDDAGCRHDHYCNAAGVCTVARLDEAECTRDAQCESDVCCDGHCCGGPCCPAGSGDGETCLAVGALCETCRDDDDCLSSQFCNAAGQCVGDRPNGVACARDAQCTSDLCCADTCCAGTCCAGTCVELGVRCDTCATDADCFFDEFCNSLGRCVAERGPGAPCNRAAQCATNNCCGVACCNGTCCQDGTCIAGGGNCVNCTDDTGCRTDEYCNAQGLCTPDLAGGNACDRDRQCASGRCCSGTCCGGFCCLDGTCAPPGGGCGACTVDDHCPSHQVCAGGVCQTPGVVCQCAPGTNCCLTGGGGWYCVPFGEPCFSPG